MGYTTDFHGSWTVTPLLSFEHAHYLQKFNGTRRMRRNAELTALRPDPVRDAVGLPVGPEGAYFVGAEGFAGQEHEVDVLDYNTPPQGQPCLWCQWTPSATLDAIVWDEGEKFYDFDAWLEYLLAHFLIPWGYTVNGDVEWCGEDPNDRGLLRVRANVLTVYDARVLYVDEEGTVATDVHLDHKEPAGHLGEEDEHND